MSLDSNIEFFTYELFNRLWLDSGLITTPFPRRKGTRQTESCLTEDIVKAVKVRQILFSQCYQTIFSEEYLKFSQSTADFYDFLVHSFPHKDQCYSSVMHKIFALCGFVAEMCQFCISEKNPIFANDAYLFCAMYIDQELKTQFYQEGDWLTLLRMSQHYISPYEFLVQCSSLDQREGRSTLSHSVQHTIDGIDSYQRYVPTIPHSKSSPTLRWVDHCLEEQNFNSASFTTPLGAWKTPTIEVMESVLGFLANHCDPLEYYVRSFGEMVYHAIDNKLDLKLHLNYYFKNRLEQYIPEPKIPEVDFLVLEHFTHLLKIDHLLKNESVNEIINCNSEVGAAEMFGQSHFKSVSDYMRDEMDTRTKILEVPNKVSEINFNPCASEVADILKTHSSTDVLDYAIPITNVDELEIINQVKSVISVGTAETSRSGKENSSNVQSLIAKLSPEMAYTGFLSTTQVTEDEKNILLDKLSNFKINNIETGKENSSNIQSLIAKISPEMAYTGFLSTTQVTEEEKNILLGKLSNFKINEIERSPSYNRCSDAISKGRMGIKENSIVQGSNQNRSLSRILPSSLSTSTSTVLEPCICPLTDKVIAKDYSTCFDLHSQEPSPNTSITSNGVKDESTNEILKNTSKVRIAKLPNGLPEIASAATAPKICINPVTDELGDPCNSATAVEVFSKHPLVSASNNISRKDEVHQQERAMENCQARTNTLPPSKVQTGAEFPSSSEFSKRKKNKSKKKEKTKETNRRKTRRQFLEETEEHAQDILRMIIVLGNKTSLEIMKPTLQCFK